MTFDEREEFMGIMDNEGHDPLGFGNVLSRTDANDLRRLKIEHAQLLEQFSHADAAIEQLTKEREEYRTRWLGSVTPEEGGRLHDENVRLRIAGRRLESAAQDVYLPEEPDAAMWQELRDAAQAMRIACGDEQK